MPSTKVGVAIDLRAEGDAGQDGELLRRVEAFDVEARIGFGIAERLRLLQRVGVGCALLHPRQDEIAGAVQDAVEARQPVAGERLAKSLDDRDAAADRRLEGKLRAAFLGKLGELRRPAARAAPCWR